MRRVVVTGLGAVTPLGLGVRRSWKRLIDGECGIKSLNDQGTAFKKLQCQVAGVIPQGSKEQGAWTASEWLTRDDQRHMAQYMQYAVVAAREALDDAGWHPEDPKEQDMTGVCIGSGIGSFEDFYNTSLAFAEKGPKKVSPLFVPRLLINLAAGHISMRYGFRGPNHAVSTACTTGAHSIGDAARFIACGDADVMVAGGAESCIHPLAIIGFERSRSLTTSWNDQPNRSSRPFNSDRDGFVMGEGAGVLVLEELSHALYRKAPIYALLASSAYTSDAHHPTHPPISGHGASRSMALALQKAQISPAKVDYINAHGTSTVLGDSAENRAITEVMRGVGGKKWAEEICVSSTKGATGHLLGAAGAVEAVFSVCAIRNNVMPPTLNLTDLDKDEFPFDYVPLVSQERSVDVVLSNSFGFGGTNATLCFERYAGQSSS
ncbi:Mitochondrial beta-keto-acyl synthase [Varicellaria rhodocarpa]|nr:Mitochondrial beta-keto-acyl synthase [Varicellaria rhodocarpa]